MARVRHGKARQVSCRLSGGRDSSMQHCDFKEGPPRTARSGHQLEAYVAAAAVVPGARQAHAGQAAGQPCCQRLAPAAVLGSPALECIAVDSSSLLSHV